MQIFTAYGTQNVFTKTAKGREEIAHRVYQLNERQRLVLMVIDGSKKLDTLTAKIPAHQLQGEIAFLLKHGFIASSPQNPTEAKLERLKNPEILTPKSRGGFASAAIIPSE